VIAALDDLPAFLESRGGTVIGPDDA